MDHVLEIYSLFMFLGIFSTMLLPETARKTLEELCGEDDYAANNTSVAVPANGASAPEAGVLEKRTDPEESL